MDNYKSSKRPGNLLSAFVSDFQQDLSDKFVKLKHKLVEGFGNESNLDNSWSRLLKEFEHEATSIKELGFRAIPQVEFSKLRDNKNQFPPDIQAEIWKRGCVLIKGVTTEEEALGYKAGVKKYIEKHPGEIAGFPDENPQVWELYWSNEQVAARSHPNFVAATFAVNQLWHASPDTPIDLRTNLTYCDRLRIREKGDKSFTLNEHIDGGSVERWEDPEYRKCYQAILEGKWEEYDAFDATHRVKANMDLYDCSGGCSMFRSFQGWMSLSHVKSGEGTLRLCPLIKHSTAYLILRPLLKDIRDSLTMAGATPGAQQHILPDIHRHIVDCMVSIPAVAPGDCVFWHCDCVHAVEGVCSAPEDSSVFYIPASPLCSKNVDYLKREKMAFVRGETPPDFPANNCEVGFQDRGMVEDLTEFGKLGMGFLKFESNNDCSEGAKQAVEYANMALGH